MKGKGLFISKIKSFLILSLAIIFLTQGCGGGGSSPSGVADRLIREFMERLFDKLGTGKAVMDPGAVSAAFGNRSDSRM